MSLATSYAQHSDWAEAPQNVAKPRLHDELLLLQRAILAGKLPQFDRARSQLQTSLSAVDAPVTERHRKRQRIESDLQEQDRHSRRRSTSELDVDEILARAQSVVAHTSGIKASSSFDENDYYSSQVESVWSPNLKDAEDDYVPAAAELIEEESDTTSLRDDSEYEPDAVQDTAGAFATSPTVVPLIRNHLTHLAAPQASKVSPLTSAAAKGYELQLVDGRPEVVKVLRNRKVSAQARLSSASPPARISKRKARDSKRDAKRNLKLKKRKDRQMGLDMSNQLPPQTYVEQPTNEVMRPQTGYTMVQPVMPRPAPLAQPYDPQPVRSISTNLQQYQPLEYLPTAVAPRAPHDMSSAHVSKSDARVSMAPPPAPPRAAKRIVVDQFGNRYVESEPESPAIRSMEEPALPPGFQRAPSRLQTARHPDVADQYDPTDAHFEMPPSRRAVVPSYPIEYIDGRRYRVRELVDDEPMPASMMPTSPEFRPPQQAAMQPFAYQGQQMSVAQPYNGAELAMHAVPQQTMQYQPPRAYSVHPDQVHQMPLQYAPRQGSVAPVQYIRHEPSSILRPMSVVPGQPPVYGADPRMLGAYPASNIQYVETRTYEGQPMQEFRHYQ